MAGVCGGLVVGVATEARKDRIVASVGVAISAAGPLAGVDSAVDREGMSECRSFPGGD